MQSRLQPHRVEVWVVEALDAGVELRELVLRPRADVRQQRTLVDQTAIAQHRLLKNPPPQRGRGGQ